MGKFMLKLLVGLMAFNFLVVAGLFGYGVATGHFTPELRKQYLATWKGEKLVTKPKVEKKVVEKQTPRQAGAKIAAIEVQREIVNRNLQRQMELFRDMQFTIDAARAKMDKDKAELQKEKAKFAEELARQKKQAEDVGFQKALKSYVDMNPKLVKDDFMAMNEDEVVRFLSAMKPDTISSILGKFKTPEEQAKRRSLVEKLQQAGVVTMGN